MDKRVLGFIGGAFVAGVLFGHFAGASLFGYRSYEECVAKEAKGAGIMAAVVAARQYCTSQFPEHGG